MHHLSQFTDSALSLGSLVGVLTLLTLAGCDAPAGAVAGPSPNELALAGHARADCVHVKGTGFASGSAVPVDGRVSATGPIEGDLTGTITLVRDATASTRNGNGATFLTYDEAVLDSNELGMFTGAADASVNFGLVAEGVRTDRGIAHIEFTGPASRSGLMKLNIVFDLGGFPVIAATYRYQGRLCGA